VSTDTQLTPSFAIGEVEALVLKAYRGAGFTWGMAQEAGKAAGWLSRRRLPAIDAFASLLSRTAEQDHSALAPDVDVQALPEVWSGRSGLLCPVITGVLLSDLGALLAEDESVIRLESVAAPLILLPFVATLPACRSFTAVDADLVIDMDIIVRTNGDAETAGVDVSPLMNQHTIALHFAHRQHNCAPDTHLSQPPDNGPIRGTGSAASVVLLERLAHQTYVPASPESRKSGAGAGLQDND
jgi:hypothetical protein